MIVTPFKLEETNDHLTAQAGLLIPARAMDKLGIADLANWHLPGPGSNRGHRPSDYLQTFMLLLHSGRFRLDDVRQLQDDEALAGLMNLKLPCAVALGNWLRRLGQAPDAQAGLAAVNRHLLSTSLHRCQHVTLDIDASEVRAEKAGAAWTYTGHRGYMPMIGHIAETDQVAAVDFRPGNASPARDNLAFIKKCEQSLPEGVAVKAVRIDAAGYQKAILGYCHDKGISYAIRARMTSAVKELVKDSVRREWRDLLDADGRPTGRQTWRTVHEMGPELPVMTVVIERKLRPRQESLDLGLPDGDDGQKPAQASLDLGPADIEFAIGKYVHRAIITNLDDWSDSEIIHWYNQRGECSENRIKELKTDFGADTLPCSDFDANATYLHLTALAYNLYALMRDLSPAELSRRRALSARPLIYFLPAKVVRSGRQVIVKMCRKHKQLMTGMLAMMDAIGPPATAPPVCC